MITLRASKRMLRAGRGCHRRGVATVEMAFVLPLLVTLLFGTVEIGWMLKQSQSLNHVSREVARVASIGAPCAQIHSRVAEASPGLDVERLTCSLQFRAWNEDTGMWGEWMTLTDNGAENSAATGDQIRVQLQYVHSLAAGRLMAGVLDASEDNTLTLNAAIVSMRE
ncbi:MAG: TadE/TadG family type IV pilus assembly protein [Armatimonadota bacterium]